MRPSKLVKCPLEGSDIRSCLRLIRRELHQNANPPRPLSPHIARPCSRRAAEQRDKVAPFQWQLLPCFRPERYHTSRAGDLLHCGISKGLRAAMGQSRPTRSKSHDSASPLRVSKRTICTPSQQVRLVPAPDVSRCSIMKPELFDHLVSAGEK